MANTPVYNLEKPTVGASSNTWGGILNSDLDLLDGILDNIQTQVTSKAAISGATLTGATLTSPTLTSPISTSPTLGSVITITGGTQSWTVTAGAENLTFAYNGVNVMRVDGSGNLVVTGNIETAGTIS